MYTNLMIWRGPCCLRPLPAHFNELVLCQFFMDFQNYCTKWKLTSLATSYVVLYVFYRSISRWKKSRKNNKPVFQNQGHAGLPQYQPLYMLSTSSFDWWHTKTDYWLCPGAKNWNIFHILCSLERVEISYPLPNHWVVWLYGTGSLSIFAWLPQIWYGLKAEQVGFYM